MKKIIHCDADCFFAAVEMRDNPRLKGLPIAVGGGGRRGVISTCNYIARNFGVRSAMASGVAKRLCPHLIILPHRMEVYREVSMAMRHIFYEFTDLVEPLSLDEAYLDVSESNCFQGSATLIAVEIKKKIQSSLGITVSAGVASNKFLAKIASDWKKPDGLFVIPPQESDNFLGPLAVSKLFGVGASLSAKLVNIGIETCGDLKKHSVFDLVRRFGNIGVRLHELSNGIDLRAVNPARRRKSLSVEHTFETDLTSVKSCLNELPQLYDQLKMRLAAIDDAYKVIKLFVKIKCSDFRVRSIEVTSRAVDLNQYLIMCRDLCSRSEDAVRLVGLGVRFYDLREDRAFYQLDLFS